MDECTKKEAVGKVAELFNSLSRKEIEKIVVDINKMLAKKHKCRLKVIAVNVPANHDWMPEDSNGTHQKSEKTVLLM